MAIMQQVLEKECAAAVSKASSTISRITFFWGLSSKIFRSVVTIHIFFHFSNQSTENPFFGISYLTQKNREKIDHTKLQIHFPTIWIFLTLVPDRHVSLKLPLSFVNIL